MLDNSERKYGPLPNKENIVNNNNNFIIFIFNTFSKII